ncbi:hypothetical protein M9458_021028, partial [Cirrhinus mrigala]
SAAVSDDTDISKEKKKSKKKKRKNKNLESVDGQTDPSEETCVQETQDVEEAATDLTEKMESNAELSEGDSERTHVNSSTEPADKQPKAFKLLKRKRRKKTVSRKTSEDASEGANDSSEMEIGVTSAEIVTTVPLKKKQKLKKKANDIGEGETGSGCAESELSSACLTGCVSATAPVDVSTATPSKKKLRKPSSDEQMGTEVKEQRDSQKTVDPSDSSKASRKTPIKKKKQKDVVSGVPEPDTNGEVDDLQTETRQQPAGRRGMKKSKQKSAADQITPARKRRVKEEEVKPSQVNGHTDETSVKRPKIISEDKEPSVTKNKKAKEFVLRQKKAPAPIFCKAAGSSTRMASKK